MSEVKRVWLDPRHAIYDFATEEETRGYVTQMVKYDGTRQCLIATNVSIAISVPVAANISHDFFISAQVLKAACKEAGSGRLALEPSGDKAFVVDLHNHVRRDGGSQEGRYPDYHSLVEKEPPPNVVFALSPVQLKILVDYALAQGSEQIVFATNASAEDDDAVATIDGMMQFRIDDAATGLIAPRPCDSNAWKPATD